MTIAADCQLALLIDDGGGGGAGGWAGLPEQARAQVLVLLARLIARGVLIAEEPTSGISSAGAGRG
jgi:hypothetical protein